MIRASFTLFAIFLVVLRRASMTDAAATEVSKTTPALLDSAQVTIGGDLSNVTLRMDGQVYTKNGVEANKLLLHKTQNDSSIGVTGCSAVPTTSGDPICACTGVQTTPAPATAGNYVSAAGGAGNGQAGGVPQAFLPPLYIWQSFCQNQVAMNKPAYICNNTASPNQTACVQTQVVGAGNTGVSGGPPVVVGQTSTQASNSTKAGASMTTSQVTILTIGPLAMLAFANFVV